MAETSATSDFESASLQIRSSYLNSGKQHKVPHLSIYKCRSFDALKQDISDRSYFLLWKLRADLATLMQWYSWVIRPKELDSIIGRVDGVEFEGQLLTK